MVNVYFFYGLAFILMGLFIFVIPKKQDLLGLSDNLWLVGLFGLLHGLNEWADLFILKGEPFDIEGLKTIGTFLLPISFIFLVIFGARVIVKNNNKLQWLNFLWAVCALIWAGAYFFTKDTVVFGAVARYFICIPGTLLTAFALHLSIKQVDKHVIPRVVILEISIVVFTIVAYGILSGFIVPKAEFFPASVVNYSSFSNLIGLPVQFFRMICAIIIAICLFGITKYYFFKEDRIKIRGGIGSKTAVLIITVAVFVMSISTILGYMTETKLLRKTIGLDHQEIARLISISITKNFNEEIEDIRIIISDPAWKNAIAEHNLKYTEMRPEDVNSYFIDMDKRWIDVSLDSSLTKEYLENEASIELKIAIENAINIKELFITDSFGGLVATSGKTSDFYQADKEWWKFAFNKDKIYVGNLEFDESADIMAIAIAVPIKDDKEKIIGVAKAILSGKELFSFLDDFKIGESGHAVVVDQDGYAIYHHELKTLEEERFYKHENVLNKSEKWFELKAPHDHGNNLFVAYAEITQHNFLENGHKWRVFIDQDTDEVLKPLKELAVKRFLPMLGLIMFLIPIGFVYGRIFTKPIIELSKIAEDIGKGNLDVRADVNTSDELEDLANSFNMMIKNLKISTTSIENLNKEIGERKLVEAALSESEEKFRALYEYSNDAIMILASPDWRFISGNSATIKMFGVENEAEFVSMGLWELSPKYQPEGQLSSVKSMAMIKEALTCGSKFFEWKHKRLNGSEFFATVLLTKMQLGDIETVQATVRDITERKKAEKENQELLHFLNERVKEIKCLYDISKLFEIPNITLEDIFQGSVDRISYGWQYPKITCARLTVEGKEFKSDNFKVTKWKQSENIVLHGNKIGVVEVFYLEEKPEADEGPFLKEEGELLRVIAESLARDIEYKKSEEVIKKSAEEWQRTFDSITDLIFIQDKESNIVRVNKAFAAAMKIKPEEIIGKKCYEIVHGRNEPWPGCPFQAMMKSKEACSREVDDHRIGIPLVITVSPIFDDEGKIIGSVHIAKDISERKKLERLKDEFVSTVSHELRTPLSIIKEGVSLVLDEIPGKVNQKQKNILKMSSDNIGRLGRIINNLLDISKIEAGKLKLNKSIVDVCQIIKNVCKEWELESNKKTQDLYCSMPNKSVNIFVNSDKITQILDNLVSNAIKYTSVKGRIKIELIDNKDNVEISISDTGQGISKEDLPKVFSKFQQFGRLSGPGAKGTGLGLAITKNLIEEHGGTIKVESKFNKGTKFIVLLPKRVNT